jgi:cytosine deaminase
MACSAGKASYDRSHPISLQLFNFPVQALPFDLVIANVRFGSVSDPVDIAIADGKIAKIGPAIVHSGLVEDGQGMFAFGGFVESHIHLDKAMILDRCPICEGTLGEAIALTAKAKAGFTEADVYLRASQVVEKAILQGTMRMRSFVEVDPRAGFRSLDALLRVGRDYAWAIDIELCAFAQEGITNEPETAAMLAQALEKGAHLVGGCPYTDPDPHAHVEAIFELALRYDVDVDFHADFDLDPDNSILPKIAAETIRHGYQGRVSVGHVTKLAAMTPEALKTAAGLLAEAGIAVTILPATDLFLTGRGLQRLAPRGVAPGSVLSAQGVLVSLASNNILNPFTPFGDCSLARIANLYANVAHLARDVDMEQVFSMVTANAALQLRAPYGMSVGSIADIVLIDAQNASDAVRSIAPVAAGWKRGRKTFERPRAKLFRP